jgi:hypothetical protein
MSKTIEKHIALLRSGKVDKATVAGLRRALNNHERAERGYSVSSTAANMTAEERDVILDEILYKHPALVVGELAETGKALLQSKRYAKQLASVAYIIADIDHFTLVGFDYIGQYGDHVCPVYRAHNTKGESFPFRNVPWQSGGNGPEIMSGNYY